MTRGMFIDALSDIDERFIIKAISNEVLPRTCSKQSGWIPALKALVASACLSLVLIITIVASRHFIKERNTESGIELISNDPQILYCVAITSERNIYSIDEDIPVTIHIGTGREGAYVDEIIILSVSEDLIFREGNPILLRAENGDYSGSQLIFDDSVFYKEDKTLEDLPFNTTLFFTAENGGEQISGQVDIIVKISGTGFHEEKAVTLYYSINGSSIAFSTKSEEDAGSYFS